MVAFPLVLKRERRNTRLNTSSTGETALNPAGELVVPDPILSRALAGPSMYGYGPGVRTGHPIGQVLWLFRVIQKVPLAISLRTNLEGLVPDLSISQMNPPRGLPPSRAGAGTLAMVVPAPNRTQLTPMLAQGPMMYL